MHAPTQEKQGTSDLMKEGTDRAEDPVENPGSNFDIFSVFTIVPLRIPTVILESPFEEPSASQKKAQRKPYSSKPGPSRLLPKCCRWLKFAVQQREAHLKWA